MKKHNFDSYFYGTFFRLSGVIILQNLLIYSVNLADNIMIGRYSEVAMNGVSLANQIQFLLQMLALGTSNGMSVLAAQYWGKRSTEPIKKIFAAANWFAVTASLALSVFVIAFPQTALGLLTDKQDAIEEGSKYIVIMGFTYCIYAVTNLLLGMLRSVETVHIGFIVTAVSLVINVSLNYILIFGKFGAPELGVRGAAFATVTSRVAELVIVCVYVFAVDKKIRLKPADLFRTDRTYMRDFLKTGLPLIGSNVSWGIAMSVQTAILGRLDSPYVLGANNIATTLFQVASVLYTSISNASSVLIGKTVGEGDVPRVKRYAKRMQVLFLIFGLVSSAIMLVTSRRVIALYNVSDGTAALARTFILILSVTIIGSSYEAPCLCGIVSGGGQTNFVLINDLIWMWGIILPMAVLSAFVFHWPIPVTFFILKADQITKCAVAVVKVNRFRWIRDLTRDAA